jgi:anti-anti-sigma factor
MSSEIDEKFETEVAGDVRVIRLPADMPPDFTAREPYRRALAKVIEEHSEKKLIINLRNAPFYDSMSVGVLVSAQWHLNKRGIQCRFCGVSEQTRWAIEATQLTKVLAVFDDEAAALDGF